MKSPEVLGWHDFDVDGNEQIEQLKWCVENYREGDILRYEYRIDGKRWALVRNRRVERPQTRADSENWEERYRESRESWTDGAKAFDDRFPTVDDYIKRFRDS